MPTRWKPFRTAPKDGRQVILWVCSEKGFPDEAHNFYYANHKNYTKKVFSIACPDGEGWYWAASESKLTRPDLIKGWLPYPQPPKRQRKKKLRSKH